jgi:hypothetical protein
MDDQKAMAPLTLPLIEYLRIVRLKEASRLAGQSQKTLRAKYPEKIIKRGGQASMRVGHALQLPEPTTATTD